VKQGTITQSPGLLGFHTWKVIIEFIAQPEGEYLCGLVGLVQGYGDTMFRTITKYKPEESVAGT
jgi:hypothetical protein